MDDATPRSVEEALTRARGHAQRAAREGVQAARALADAASLAALGRPAGERAALAGVMRAIDDIARALEGGTVVSPIFDALHESLDAEIGRWEKRAESDRDARSVLRAFLGVREIMWEMGVRKRSGGSRSGGADPSAGPKPHSGETSSRGDPEPRSPASSEPAPDGRGAPDARPGAEPSVDAPASQGRRRVQRIDIQG